MNFLFVEEPEVEEPEVEEQEEDEPEEDQFLHITLCSYCVERNTTLINCCNMWSMINRPCSSLKIKQGSGPTKRRTGIYHINRSYKNVTEEAAIFLSLVDFLFQGQNVLHTSSYYSIHNIDKMWYQGATVAAFWNMWMNLQPTQWQLD